MPSEMDKIFSPIKGRLLEYIDSIGITKEKFYSESGLSPSNFKGKGAISELGGDKIANILTIYRELSPKWLLTGAGSMTGEGKVQATNLPSGPCQQCEQRERIISSQHKTIELLEEKIEGLLHSQKHQPPKK